MRDIRPGIICGDERVITLHSGSFAFGSVVGRSDGSSNVTTTKPSNRNALLPLLPSHDDEKKERRLQLKPAAAQDNAVEAPLLTMATLFCYDREGVALPSRRVEGKPKKPNGGSEANGGRLWFVVDVPPGGGACILEK